MHGRLPTDGIFKHPGNHARRAQCREMVFTPPDAAIKLEPQLRQKCVVDLGKLRLSFAFEPNRSDRKLKL
jgi:hypothetical protein